MKMKEALFGLENCRKELKEMEEKLIKNPSEKAQEEFEKRKAQVEKMEV